MRDKRQLPATKEMCFCGQCRFDHSIKKQSNKVYRIQFIPEVGDTNLTLIFNKMLTPGVTAWLCWPNIYLFDCLTINLE